MCGFLDLCSVYSSQWGLYQLPQAVGRKAGKRTLAQTSFLSKINKRGTFRKLFFKIKNIEMKNYIIIIISIIVCLYLRNKSWSCISWVKWCSRSTECHSSLLWRTPVEKPKYDHKSTDTKSLITVHWYAPGHGDVGIWVFAYSFETQIQQVCTSPHHPDRSQWGCLIRQKDFDKHTCSWLQHLVPWLSVAPLEANEAV